MARRARAGAQLARPIRLTNARHTPPGSVPDQTLYVEFCRAAGSGALEAACRRVSEEVTPAPHAGAG